MGYQREHGASRICKRILQKVEAELQKICDTILNLLDNNLITKAGTGESKVFYQRMKADDYRYIAEFSDGDVKSKAAENARLAYEDASKVAEKDLAVTHPSLVKSGGSMQNGPYCICGGYCR